MGFKAAIAKIFAGINAKTEKNWIDHPIEIQNKIFQELISTGRQTQFGKEHNFACINTYEDFKKQVPIRDYEALKSYIDLIRNGNSDVLWVGKPIYFAKTSGTTSGSKYI